MRLIEDDKDVVSMCKLNKGGLRDTIILYVESGLVPLVVEVPDGARVGARGAGVGAGASVGGGVGAAIGSDASVGVDKEFSPPHTVPFKPNIIPTTDTP